MAKKESEEKRRKLEKEGERRERRLLPYPIYIFLPVMKTKCRNGNELRIAILRVAHSRARMRAAVTHALSGRCDAVTCDAVFRHRARGISENAST